MAIATRETKRLYLTVRDPKGGSKTTTLVGDGLTPERVIALVLRAVKESNKRKAG